MQLLDTQIDLTDHGATRVRFVGEGGDAIEVSIADGANCQTDDEAIARAKVMLLQIAQFEIGEPDDHQATLGYASDRHEHGKRRYRLEYSEGEHIRRTPEAEFIDEEAVRCEVERSALDMIEMGARPGHAHSWAVRAVDTDDNVIASITFEEAQRLQRSDGEEALPAAPI